MDSKATEPRHALVRRRNARQAFTLLEMAVVVAIIGLIVGSIFVGRELIRAAELRSVVKQYDQFNQAALAFKLKFNCLPGDCAEADRLGFDPLSSGDGDGNVGYCDGGGSCSVYQLTSYLYFEFYYFWYQLAAAGMISFQDTLPLINSLGTYPGTQSNAPDSTLKPGIVSPGSALRPVPHFVYPLSEFPGGWWLSNALSYRTAWGEVLEFPRAFLLTRDVDNVAGDADGSTNYAAEYNGQLSAYWPRDMQSLDAKVDDGLPETGTVLAYNDYDKPAWSGPPAVMPLVRYSANDATAGSCGSGASASQRKCVCNAGNGQYIYNTKYTWTADPSPWNGLCSVIMRAAF